MIVMSSSVYFVDTNDVGVTGRLFVKLSNGTIFYFGEEVELMSKEIGPYAINFRRKSDHRNKVYRSIEFEVHALLQVIVEKVYAYGESGMTPLSTYKYRLSDLIRNTQDQKRSDLSYWGEYKALEEKRIVSPTFPLFVKQLD